MAWKGIVNQSFTPDEFEGYVAEQRWTAWRPSFVVLHNTASPTLAQRPHGFTHQHMLNLEGFFRDQNHWSAGPHLFVDDAKIWVFTPLTTSGIHSPSWNHVSLGVEMLGNYATEGFSTGRGLEVQRNAVAAIATLSAVLGIDSHSMKLHWEDPATNHACPGSNVQKAPFIQGVHDLILQRHAGDHAVP